MKIELNKAKFIIAAHKESQWFQDEGLELAFAGRSNSGKSSALNAITERRGLARTSKTPGRTQQIVFFELTETLRLVDLPGYGYAKVPDRVRLHWARVIEKYFLSRKSLNGLILTMDIRHPLKELDRQFIYWCSQVDVSIHILLTKADKLSKSKMYAALRSVNAKLKNYDNISVQAFSSRTGIGLDQAKKRVCDLLTDHKKLVCTCPVCSYSYVRDQWHS